MKKRQRRENGIVFPRIEQHAKLRDVADDVAVTEHNAFGVAGAAAGEKQTRFGVSAFLRNLQHAQKQPAGQKIDIIHQKKICRFNRGMSSSSFTTRSGHGKSFNRSMNGGRGNRDPQIGALAAGFDGGAAAGEIEIDRNFPGERHGEICDHRAFARRQNDGDSFDRETLFADVD